MAIGTAWLIDKSAYVRISRSTDEDQWYRRMERGLVRISTLSLLELGFSARSFEGLQEERANPPLSYLPQELIAPRAEERALELQALLAARGHHRAVKIPDLLVATCAEAAGLTVLHVDKDFDLIASVTGQPVERLRGDF